MSDTPITDAAVVIKVEEQPDLRLQLVAVRAFDTIKGDGLVLADDMRRLERQNTALKSAVTRLSQRLGLLPGGSAPGAGLPS